MKVTQQHTLNTGKTQLIEQPDVQIDSNWFDLSHGVPMSCNPGKLVPILCKEALPGDVWYIKPEIFTRMAPMVNPPMQRMAIRTYYFYMANRNVWSYWSSFMSKVNSNSTLPAFPVYTGAKCIDKSVAAYFGLPSAPSPGLDMPNINAIPLMMYQAITWRYFTNPNLQVMPDPYDSIYQLASGNNGAGAQFFGANSLVDDLWDMDYFTSAQPYAQRGNPVVIPVVGSGGSLPVSLLTNGSTPLFRSTTFGIANGSNLQLESTSSDLTYASPFTDQSGGGNVYLKFDPNGTLGITSADMQSFGGLIEDLRTASALQRFLEANLAGNTYDVWVKMNFGTDIGDATLQYPVYLGSTFQPLVISEVVQTSESASTPQGNLAGHGVSARNHGNVVDGYKCKEHGYIIALYSCKPTTGYSQGIEKFFTKFDPFDYGIPTMALLGMQNITNQEIFYANNPSQDTATWAFQPRYQEYRTATDRLLGEFRTTLSSWTLSRRFDSLPSFSDTFTQLTPEECMRIFASTDVADDHLYNQIYFDIKVNRKLPKYVQPVLR